MKTKTTNNFAIILLILTMFIFSVICIALSVETNNVALAQEGLEFNFTDDNTKELAFTSYCQETYDYDYAYIDCQEESFLSNQSFVVPFIVNSKDYIRSYSYSQVGFTILSSTIINTKQINIELRCLPNVTEYYLSLDIELTSNCSLNVPLYAVSNETGVYICMLFPTKPVFT